MRIFIIYNQKHNSLKTGNSIKVKTYRTIKTETKQSLFQFHIRVRRFQFIFNFHLFLVFWTTSGRDLSWWDAGDRPTICGAWGNQTQVGSVQSKHLTCCSIAPTPENPKTKVWFAFVTLRVHCFYFQHLRSLFFIREREYKASAEFQIFT